MSNNANGSGQSAPPTSSRVDDGFKRAMIDYLYRQREQQLGSLAATEDLLIALGQPVKRTKERRAYR